MQPNTIVAGIRSGSAKVPKISFGTAGDDKLLDSLEETWDTLNSFKEEVAQEVLNFVCNVQDIQRVFENLSNVPNHLKEAFNKQLNVFYSDVDGFTKSVEKLRTQHEHKTGRIESIDDYGLYTNLSIEYATLTSNLTNLVSPTVAGLVLTIQEAAPNQPSETQS